MPHNGAAIEDERVERAFRSTVAFYPRARNIASVEPMLTACAYCRFRGAAVLLERACGRRHAVCFPITGFLFGFPWPAPLCGCLRVKSFTSSPDTIGLIPKRICAFQLRPEAMPTGR
jgi:hypothetical protein